MQRPRALPLGTETPAGSSTPWAWLAWLHDRNLDGIRDDALLFEDIRDLRLLPAPHGGSFVDTTGDATGTPDPVDLDGDGTPDPYPANGRGLWPEGRRVYLTITCSGYRNPPPGVAAIREPCAVEFGVDLSPMFLAPPQPPMFFGPDGLAAAGLQGVPHWRFARDDYVRAGCGPDGLIRAGPDGLWATPDDDPTTSDDYTILVDPTGNARQKPWQPTSCQRLEDGTHVVVNAAPQPANVTPANFPGQDTNCSEIIQVLTDYTVAPLATGRHLFGRWELIPDPNLAPWTERLSQPAYAERY
jgi:hypothetical protein